METGDPCFHTGILKKRVPVSIRGSPYENGAWHILKWKKGNPCFEVGKIWQRNLSVNWGCVRGKAVFLSKKSIFSPKTLIFLLKNPIFLSKKSIFLTILPLSCACLILARRIDTSPFPYGDGSVTNPFPNRVCAHLGIEEKIPIWECFPYGDRRFHMVIPIQTCKKFPFGDSLLPNSIFAHMGINRYTLPVDVSCLERYRTNVPSARPTKVRC